MKKIILMILLLCRVVFGAEWELVKLIDEFGDNTGDVVITTSIENGIFSNTATSNSKLDGFIKVGTNSISFNTYEYGYSRGVKSDMKDITVKMKNSNNEILNIGLSSMYVFDFPQYNSYDAKKIKNFIKKSNGKVKVIIYGKYSKVQKFSFNANGFTKNLKLIKNKKKKVMLQYKDGLAYEKNKRTPYTGEWLGYYENGQVLVEVNFKNGKRDGERVIYDKDGEVEFKTTFKDGKIID